MQVRDPGVRRKDEPIPFLGQAKTELLVFHAGGCEDRVEAAIFEKDIAAVCGGIGIDEVDLRLTAHAIVAILVLGLHEARNQCALLSDVRPLSAYDAIVDKGRRHRLDPRTRRSTVAIRKQD